MQTNPAPVATTRRRAPVAAKPKLLYPDPDKLPKRLFWLANYFRDIAKLQALLDLMTEMHRRGGHPDALFHALYGAQGHQRDAIELSLSYVVSDGLLLFAFQETTVMQATS